MGENHQVQVGIGVCKSLFDLSFCKYDLRFPFTNLNILLTHANSFEEVCGAQIKNAQSTKG